MIKNSKDSASENEDNNKRTQNNRNKKFFSDFFTELNRFLQKIKSLEDLGFKLPDKFFNNIILKNSDKSNVENNLETEINNVEKELVKWRAKLNKINKQSVDGYELNSLFGKNFIYLNEKNFKHYLLYFMTREEFDKLENHLILNENMTSSNKVDNLIQLNESMNNYSIQPVKNKIEYYEYTWGDNVYDVMLQILKPISCNNKEFSNLESQIFFRRNQILLCTKHTKPIELESILVIFG